MNTVREKSGKCQGILKKPVAMNPAEDMQTAVDTLLSKGAVEPVYKPETQGFFSRLFLVPK